MSGSGPPVEMARRKTFIACLLLVLCVGSSATVKLFRREVTNASQRGAVCNDHTPAIFYVDDDGASRSSTKWMVFLEGGGLCTSAVECASRYVSQRYHLSSNVSQYATELEGKRVEYC